MEEKRSWGSIWTYAVFLGIMVMVQFIVWYLVEQRRDLDAAIFDEVSELNEKQVMKVQGYVLAMQDGVDKTNLSGLLDSISIIRTRGEMKALYPPEIYDKIPSDLIKSTRLIYIKETSFTVAIEGNEKVIASGKYGTTVGDYDKVMINEDNIFSTDQRLKATGLTPGTTYYIGIKVTDPSGNIDVEELVVTTKGTPAEIVVVPAPITGLKFVASGNNKIRFNENTVNPNAILAPITTAVNETYTYKIVPRTNTDDGALFSIADDRYTLNITPDYEAPLDENKNNIYGVDLVVTSGSGDTFREDMAFYIDDVIDESTPVVASIIDSVWTMNHTATWMTVRVLNLKEVKCQAVALYGTQSGVYTHTGRKEESFDWHSHHLRIGNVTPLAPNTLYYIKVKAWDEGGNEYTYPEITGRTTA